MKLIKYIKLICITCIALILTSCGLVGFDNSSVDSSFNIEDLGDYAGHSITLSMLNEASDIKTLDSTGEQNILVLPVTFKDYPLKLMGLDEEIVISNINKAFFGETNQTGFESVKSYYKKSSYDKLILNGEVAPLFTLDLTLKEVVKYKSNSDYFDPSYVVLEKACENFKANYKGDISKFDLDKDGYFDAVWVMYINPYVDDDTTSWYKLYDKNFYNTSYYNEVQELLWAYTYWDFTTKPDVNSLQPFAYCFASYSFLWDKAYYDVDGNKLVDSHTIIHETGHLLGLDDYYNYDYEQNITAPIGAIDMMDNNVGDHNAYSKYLLEWLEPQIVKNEGTYHLEPLGKSPMCLLIPARIEEFSNSPFNEYLLIEYYTPDYLNKNDSLDKYDNGIIMPNENGVRVYHIDSRLGLFEWSLLRNEFVYKGFTNQYVNTENKYVSIATSNTPSYSASGYRLITLLSSFKNTSKAYYYQDRVNNMADSRDLYQEGDTITKYTFNSNNSLNYSITFTNMNNEGVDVVITSNN